jgi:hypothetical protein
MWSSGKKKKKKVGIVHYPKKEKKRFIGNKEKRIDAKGLLETMPIEISK